MVLFNVVFADDDAVNPIRAAGATVTNAKYCKWTSDDMAKYQLQFYMLPGSVSIKKFYKDNADLLGSKIPEKTFGTYWRDSGLKTLKESIASFDAAKSVIEHYIAKVKNNAKTRITSANGSSTICMSIGSWVPTISPSRANTWPCKALLPPKPAL
jgi:hypothetical protein